LALVKPQFEVGRAQISRGGVVRDDAVRAAAVRDVIEIARSLGFEETGTVESRIAGAKKGNREVFVLFLTVDR
jgi:23S rRNA (cytidine1920-2'-O)/16S rRNA (cytidine1409-2'-O)-methyltransferase